MENAVGVCPDNPRFKLSGHTVNAGDVLGPETCGEPVLGGIGLADRVLLASEGVDGEDRTEYFLVGQGCPDGMPETMVGSRK